MTAPDKAPELLPCPFCGGEAHVSYIPRQVTMANNEGHTTSGFSMSRMPAGQMVSCKDCGCQGPAVSDDAGKVKALASELGKAPSEYLHRFDDGAQEIQEATRAQAIDAWNRRADVSDALVAAAYEAAANDVGDWGVLYTSSGKDAIPSAVADIRELTPSDARAALAEAERKAWNAAIEAAMVLMQNGVENASSKADHLDGMERRDFLTSCIAHASAKHAIAALKKETQG